MAESLGTTWPCDFKHCKSFETLFAQRKLRSECFFRPQLDEVIMSTKGDNFCKGGFENRIYKNINLKYYYGDTELFKESNF